MKGAARNTFAKSIPAFLVVMILVTYQLSYGAEKDRFQFKKQPEIQQIKPKKPVRIKLKRTSKEEYSWELSGDDVDEIVRVDKRLRKQLGAH